MGGLVIKQVCFFFSSAISVQSEFLTTEGIHLTRLFQTYILAIRDESARPLANRVSGMVFLATPHRGADLASTLSNLLKASMLHGEKPFLADLERNSIAIASINDEFRHYSDSLSLLSFYETKKTTLGYKSILIVGKDSAIMGYRNEESAALEATHRNVCKFDSPSDPNFVTLRNSLVTMTRMILQKGPSACRFVVSDSC
jgi:hypothetical protein